MARHAPHDLRRRRALPRDLLEPFSRPYFAGDGAKLDDDGYWWILGRVDDVLNVAGHRIGTMEVESALVDHPSVAEAAVVGKQHDLKGQAIAAFVTLKEGHKHSAELRDDLKEHVARKIGAIARPTTSSSAPTCPRPAAARSCAACCATSRRTRAGRHHPRSPIPASWPRLKEMYVAEES
jgi:acetyl-CoA synthetase